MIPPAIRDELEAHARAEEPNEACGLVALKGGAAERYLPGRNAAASPYRVELETDRENRSVELESYVALKVPFMPAAAWPGTVQM